MKRPIAAKSAPRRSDKDWPSNTTHDPKWPRTKIPTKPQLPHTPRATLPNHAPNRRTGRARKPRLLQYATSLFTGPSSSTCLAGAQYFHSEARSRGRTKPRGFFGTCKFRSPSIVHSSAEELLDLAPRPHLDAKLGPVGVAQQPHGLVDMRTADGGRRTGADGGRRTEGSGGW